MEIQHASDYEKIGVVGDKKWQETLTKAFKPFANANVHFFALNEKKEAQHWIKS